MPLRPPSRRIAVIPGNIGVVTLANSPAATLLLDTGDVSEIEAWQPSGVIDGVTTNPLLVAKAGLTGDAGHVRRLASLIAPMPLHTEVTVTGTRPVIAQAMSLAAEAANVVVKVPILEPDGKHSLVAMHELALQGVVVNATACFSLGQVVLAARAGARYVSVFVGRVEDEGGDGPALIADAQSWLARNAPEVTLVAGSLRGPGDVQRCWRAGAPCVTVPPHVLAKLVDHHFSRQTAAELLAAGSGAARA